MDETALGGALARMGIDYTPMTQDGAKEAVRGTLRTLLSLDTSDVDTAKHWTDDKLFADGRSGDGHQRPGLAGRADRGGRDHRQDQLLLVRPGRGTAISQKAQVQRGLPGGHTATAAQIVSTVKYGSANSVLKRTTGMLDGTSSTGGGASWASDQSNHAGHGSYSSAAKVNKLPTSNSQASYKHAGMMIYSRPEAVLGRIADFRLSQSDAFGMGQGRAPTT
jgi:hypothetical protein